MADNVPKCPLCPRIRRTDRPVCNNHMRKVGYFLGTYLSQAHEAEGKPADSPEVRRLGETIELMLHSCRTYDQIKQQGYKPYWNADLATWQNPRTRVQSIITAWHRKHRFGIDEVNDAMVIEWIAAEIVPRQL